MGNCRSKIEGLRFNDLLCLHFVDTDAGGNARFLFRCDCGVEKVMPGSKVKHGYSKTCGCGVRRASVGRPSANRLSKGEARFNAYFKEYKNSAKKRNLPFMLSRALFTEIINKECHYCGEPPRTLPKRSSRHYGDYIANGIDRKSSRKGYLPSNCVPCCPSCNIGKGTLSYNKFLTKIRRIYERLKLYK